MILSARARPAELVSAFFRRQVNFAQPVTLRAKSRQDSLPAKLGAQPRLEHW
jgi:hypothetical protein